MKRTYRGQLARKRAPATMLIGLACLAGVMDVVLLAAGRSPVKPRVIRTRYELVPMVVRTVASENPQPGAL